MSMHGFKLLDEYTNFESLILILNFCRDRLGRDHDDKSASKPEDDITRHLAKAERLMRKRFAGNMSVDKVSKLI